MKLYIVRHGQTGYNIDNKVCGISDVELTSLGKQQAKMASEQLKDISLDMIFASPLQRAHETAKIINENHQLEIKIDSRIQEINFGKFEGIVNNEEFQYYKQNHGLHYPQGESLFQVVHRVYSFLEELETVEQFEECYEDLEHDFNKECEELLIDIIRINKEIFSNMIDLKWQQLKEKEGVANV